MSEKPIIFSGPMVRAILDGRKTQTRRIVKLTEFGVSDTPGYDWHFRDRRSLWNDVTTERLLSKFAPYQVGDVLWVRETWQRVGDAPDSICTGPEDAMHKATADEVDCAIFKWKPSIFMPRWAARLFLRVTGVRVERLQDISYDDALAEGIQITETFKEMCPLDTRESFEQTSRRLGWPQRAFALLWDSLNAKRAPWSSNPWVWVIEFERIDA